MGYLDQFSNLCNMRLGELSQLQNLTILGLAATGGLFLGYHVITFVRVLLSLFVLPGKSVRRLGNRTLVASLLNSGTATQFRTQGKLGGHHWCL